MTKEHAHHPGHADILLRLFLHAATTNLGLEHPPELGPKSRRIIVVVPPLAVHPAENSFQRPQGNAKWQNLGFSPVDNSSDSTCLVYHDIRLVEVVMGDNEREVKNTREMIPNSLQILLEAFW